MDDRVLPTIDLALCTSCGLCVERCPTQAVEMVDAPDLAPARPGPTRRRTAEHLTMGGKAWPSIVRPEDCAYCGLCEEMCPEGAIALSYEIVLPADRREERDSSDMQGK
jgi:formate hydrogenlyase subunit 6/NADH:ubiquinone oxidoreductase subunit I